MQLVGESSRPFQAQGGPLWVGMRWGHYECSIAISGRVVGWMGAADHYEKGDGARVRQVEPLIDASAGQSFAVVLVHKRSSFEYGRDPVVTIDADWPAVFAGSATEAWESALKLRDIGLKTHRCRCLAVDFEAGLRCPSKPRDMFDIIEYCPCPNCPDTVRGPF